MIAMGNAEIFAAVQQGRLRPIDAVLSGVSDRRRETMLHRTILLAQGVSASFAKCAFAGRKQRRPG
jgi:hypothetical protein